MIHLKAFAITFIAAFVGVAIAEIIERRREAEIIKGFEMQWNLEHPK
jgi:hypothetical protein